MTFTRIAGQPAWRCDCCTQYTVAELKVGASWSAFAAWHKPGYRGADHLGDYRAAYDAHHRCRQHAAAARINPKQVTA